MRWRSGRYFLAQPPPPEPSKPAKKDSQDAFAQAAKEHEEFGNFPQKVYLWQYDLEIRLSLTG